MSEAIHSQGRCKEWRIGELGGNPTVGVAHLRGVAAEGRVVGPRRTRGGGGMLVHVFMDWELRACQQESNTLAAHLHTLQCRQ